MFKKLAFVIIVIAGIGFWIKQSHLPPESTSSVETQEFTNDTHYTEGASDSEKLLEFAFQNQQSDVQVQGRGKVIKLLSDDNKGSRHQRFVVQLSNQQTLLVAHNIDLAPRIDALKEGDQVEFFGEYEWNDKGGVIHWTHHDPKRSHADGWLKHQGTTYQ